MSLDYTEKISHTPCRKMNYRKVGIGDVVGRLTITELVGKTKNGSKLYSCSCTCGDFIDVISSSLNSGLTQSCGCLRKETQSFRGSTHGLSNTVEYVVWGGMKQRCYNPKTDYYHLYGGKGVRVCDRWLGEKGFENFIFDMGKRPDGYVIDRIDPDGNYEPANCRWVDVTISARNTGMKSNNKSGYKGVCFHKNTQKWQASIREGGKPVYLGVYENIEDAVVARRLAEIKFNYYGEV